MRKSLKQEIRPPQLKHQVAWRRVMVVINPKTTTCCTAPCQMLLEVWATWSFCTVGMRSEYFFHTAFRPCMFAGPCSSFTPSSQAHSTVGPPAAAAVGMRSVHVTRPFVRLVFFQVVLAVLPHHMLFPGQVYPSPASATLVFSRRGRYFKRRLPVNSTP